MTHVLGRHGCLGRIRTYRRDDSNETYLPRIFQWSHGLEDEYETEHMNGPQGRAYLNLAYHPEILGTIGDPMDPQLLHNTLHHELDDTCPEKSCAHRNYDTIEKGHALRQQELAYAYWRDNMMTSVDLRLVV